MSAAWKAVGLAIVAAALLAVSWASTAPLANAASGTAVLRVSFAARPERIEHCRVVSDAELAKVAPQMRQRTICEGTTASYQLDVRRDGRPILAARLRGGGLRHDRQLYVSRDIAVPVGQGRFEVRLTRVDTVPPGDPDDDGRRRTGDERAAGEERDHDRRDEKERATRDVEERDTREVEERRRRREEAIPAELRFEIRPTLAPREVLLVTYDANARALVARRAQ